MVGLNFKINMQNGFYKMKKRKKNKKTRKNDTNTRIAHMQKVKFAIYMQCAQTTKTSDTHSHIDAADAVSRQLLLLVDQYNFCLQFFCLFATKTPTHCCRCYMYRGYLLSVCVCAPEQVTRRSLQVRRNRSIGSFKINILFCN